MKKNRKIVFGVDEVGRGALAGPVVACALWVSNNEKLKKIKKQCGILKIRDSKKTSPKKREEIFKYAQKHLQFSLGVVGPKNIDRMNIHHATLLAMKMAVEKLIKKIKKNPTLILIDGIYKIPNLKFNQKTIIQGDTKEPAISLASICAKVYRDALMSKNLNKKYPQYKFNIHKGYGTQIHFFCIKKHGSSPAHRQTFLKNL
jgi:ribonuclease HII